MNETISGNAPVTFFETLKKIISFLCVLGIYEYMI